MEEERKLEIVLGIILALLLVSTVTSAFNIQLVKAEPRTIIVPDDYPTIQAAVDAASPGDTIIVRAGTYIENVNVNKSLTIKSESGAETTIIRAANVYDDVFEVTADHVTIKGFTVQGATYRTGIHLVGSATDNTEYCIISENICHLNDHGIWLDYSSNNIIMNNTCSLNEDVGISLNSDSNNNIILNNTCTSETGAGIELYHSFNNIILNNRCTAHDRGAIELYFYSDGNIIYLNNFIDLGQSNCWLSGSQFHSRNPITYKYRDQIYTNYLGNYWSNFSGSDNDGNGVGDTPYISHSDFPIVDNFPLIKPCENYMISPPIQTWLFDSDFQYNLDDNYGTVEGTGHLSGVATLSAGTLSIEGQITINGPLPSTIPEVYLIATDGSDKELAKQAVDLSGFSYWQTGPNTYNFTGQIPNVIQPINNGHYEVEAIITYESVKYEFFINTSSLINSHYLPLAILPPTRKNQPPVAKFEIFPKMPAVGEEIFFDASASYDPDGNIVSWAWDFNDDGEVDSIDRIPTYVYTEPGTYIVKLTVTDDKGVTSITQISLKVKRFWAFAIITDPHIGYGILDFGEQGYENDLPGQSYFLTTRLENTVRKIASLNDDDSKDYYIRFVVVLGDIVDSAEESEFAKAKEILDKLNDYEIPYIPLFGNHDAWPYTQKEPFELRLIKEEAPSAIGDEYFEKYFWSNGNNKNLALIKRLFGKSWEKESYNKPPYLQNYRFTYNGIKFICLDFVSREHIITHLLGCGGVGSDAVLYDETLSWLAQSLIGVERLPKEPTIIFSHHPIWVNYADAFSHSECEDIQEIIRISEGSDVLVNFAGHIHENKMSLEPWFTVVTTRGLLKYTDDVIRIVKVDGRTKNIDYSTFESVPWEGFPYEEYAGSTLAVLQSPGELRVYDEQGRVTGWINGVLRNEIPNAIVNETIKMIILPNPQGPYRYEVKGTAEGTYTLIIANSTRIGDSIIIFVADNLPIIENMIHQYTINYIALSEGREGVIVWVDSDGDGVFEHTFTSDSELTQSEYVIATDGIPPQTWLSIGELKFVVNGVTYLTSATPIELIAEDDACGSGVASTAYRIYNASYDSGWITYTEPFRLTGLSDGIYQIDYNSTDYAGNVESTKTATVILDNTGPSIDIENPPIGWALQDGVNFIASVSDACGTRSLNFSIREANGDQGIPVGFEDMSATYNETTGNWELTFDTLQLPDGYYIVIVDAEDNLGNTASITAHYSIRNWAVLQLLPATPNNKAGRTIPVKFSLRVDASVDPNQPFIYNEELTIKIYEKNDPNTILQISKYGTTAQDYRIDTISELYITNFQTLKTPATYVVEIYRNEMLIGKFEFKTVK